MNKSRIIVSLDFSELDVTIALARQLDPKLCRLKIGKELFTRFGPTVIEKLMKLGFDIFLDLKFHDIPNTVAGACKSAASLGVWMINVHALGGRKMLIAASNAVKETKHKPILVAVTILTSMTNDDLMEIGVNLTTQEAVIKLASLSAEAGLDGVVCSAMEAPLLRSKMDEKFCLVTPGIRPLDAEKNDQSRVVTPADAVIAGSDYLVIGRPITNAINPCN
ncbi:MAG: orotidine-5'-phosphate decarboxylase, partial [Gammaproteobacteria bacterium]